MILLKEVLTSGEAVLSAEPPELLAAAEVYNSLLEKLIVELTTARDSAVSESEERKELGAKVVTQHAEILTRMEQMRDGVGGQLKEAQRKSQVIRNYFAQWRGPTNFTGTKKG